MLTVGVVGLGWWGTELATTIAERCESLRVVAAYSPDAAQCADFVARFQAKTAPSLQAILADRAVDAVILTTPHSLHADQVVAAARAGKHVFVDKPFTLTVADGKRAIAACRDAGVTLAIGHNRRLLAAPAEMKRLIEAAALGTLLHVEANYSSPAALDFAADHWRASRDECPGGAMTAIGVHMIDWFHHLLGPVARVTAQFASRAVTTGMDDTAAALLRFECGASGSLGALYAAPYACHFTLYGSAATLWFRAAEPESPTARPTLTLQPAAGPARAIDLPWLDTLHEELEAFAAACRGQGTVAVGGIEALHNIAVLEAITASAVQDGEWMRPDYSACGWAP